MGNGQRAQHPLAGETVTVRVKGRPFQKLENGCEMVVEDWWENVGGGSWMDAVGNPAALGYASRSGFAGLPIDNEVVYGKVGGLGYLVHISELGPKVPA